jgi:hypothetical protein
MTIFFSFKLNYDRITTTIEREWLAEIIAGTKKIECRQIKPYWTKRFAKVSLPFRNAPAQRHESSSAGSDGADPQNHEGSAGGRIPIAHQEDSGIQTLGQAAEPSCATLAQESLSIAAIRSPIQRSTGTAMELPMAL